ncbi:hypothetical protein [Paenibacillus illinoisensis]|nr:hypothetical protein [Paenibacillus illinoisensis]
MNTRSLSEIMQESDGVFEKAREAVFGFNYFAGTACCEMQSMLNLLES